MAVEDIAQGMAPTQSAPAESSYGREISDADVARFVKDGVRPCPSRSCIPYACAATTNRRLHTG